MIVPSPGRQLLAGTFLSIPLFLATHICTRISVFGVPRLPGFRRGCSGLCSERRNAMKRLLIGAVGALTLAAFSLPSAPSALAAGGPGYGHPFCEQNAATCTELNQPVNGYTGHDEPSLLFYSNTPGSGNNNTWTMTLPTDAPKLPRQDGSGGTFNFQLHPAFWFGMAMCDDQSAPNPGASSLGSTVPCTPNSDSNIYNSSDLTSPRYIGRHPGTAFMEMQFYPPGWAPWPAATSCKATLWCAALNIDSFSENQNTGQTLNPTCQAITGLEYVNFAFITKNGVSQAPANPVDSTASGTFTPSNKLDLFMHSGDTLRVAMGDTADGFRVVINDRSTGQSGSMTASAANGFGEVKFAPTGTSCTNIPTNFHPMYSTSSENTRVPWAAHSYNVAFSDEIGHFEYCPHVHSKDGTGDLGTFLCDNIPTASDPRGADADDLDGNCAPAALSTLIRIDGCTGIDDDFDGPAYQTVWPGSTRDAARERRLDPSPVRFTSPLIRGRDNFQRVAFEVDMPAIETATCDVFHGTGCTNPPPGA